MILSLLVAFSESISIENPGIRLELFLKEVSKQSGQQFHCPTFLNNEVLAASFKDQSIDVLKSQLAKVIHGTWEQKPDGWWLTQTSDQKKEERKWNLDLHRSLFQWQIDALKKHAPKNEWTIKDAEKLWLASKAFKSKSREGPRSASQARALQLQSPESRLVEGIATLLKPEHFSLEGLTQDYNRYCPNGLPGHTLINIDTSDLLSRYGREKQLLSSLSIRKEVDSGKPVHIEIRALGVEPPSLIAYVYDEKWSYLVSCWASYDYGTDEVITEGENFKISPGTEAAFLLSDALMEARYERERDDEMRHLSGFPEAKKVMLNAATTDPLGLLQGRCWVDFAKGRNMPLLVSLEEDVYKSRPKYFVPTIEQKPIVVGMKRIDEDGWVLGRPINPLSNRTWRLDRTYVEAMSKYVYSPDFVTLESQIKVNELERYSSTFAKGCPNEQYFVGYDSPGNGPFCLLGTLSPGQLARCIKGERIPVEQLSDRAKTYLIGLGANSNLNEISPLFSGDWGSTPIYCLPNGIQGMSLGATMSNELKFVFDQDPSNVQESRYDLNLTIYAFAETIKKGLADSSAVLNRPFHLATERTLTASVYLGEKHTDQGIAEPPAMQNESYNWKNLPDRIRQLVLDEIKKLPASGGTVQGN